MRTRPLLAAVAGMSLLIAACGDDTATIASPASTLSPARVPTSDESMADESMADESMLAPFQGLTLTDVEGASFTLADFMGRAVFVEHFATWCPKCRQQLADTDAAAAELGSEAVVLALSVETDLAAGDVADYASDNGFDHVRFAVMTPEFLAAVSEYFGNDAINPPSTPHYVIDSHGGVGELSTGFVQPDEIADALRSAMS